MCWAQHVLMDQALRGGGMCSTECPSRLLFVILSNITRNKYNKITPLFEGSCAVKRLHRLKSILVGD